MELLSQEACHPPSSSVNLQHGDRVWVLCPPQVWPLPQFWGQQSAWPSNGRGDHTCLLFPPGLLGEGKAGGPEATILPAASVP